MTSRFFNNIDYSLFEKIRGISHNMAKFEQFCAAVGYFRASGYFKLRKELEHVPAIRILIGINIDKIFKHHTNALSKQRTMFEGNDEDARSTYIDDFVNDINKDARYSEDVEDGIYQLLDDIQSGKVILKVHPKNNLHAKFYLCLPQNHNEHTDGWVIMGSSNISEQGLGLIQPPRYELNVAMKDYEDVKYCRDEFEKLWNEAVDIRDSDVDKGIARTYLAPVTPYELYMKLLIEYFGDLVEDDFSMKLPSGYFDLKYQSDAAKQGYQMMMQHNGFILADVVGLGKTIVAAMIARRFLEANGRNTNILIVTPPAIRKGWERTFNDFGLQTRTQYVTSGSIEHVINCKGNYHAKEDYDLVIVDEAHNYRHDDSQRFDHLQTVCKSPCRDRLNNKNRRKKIILISATPLNNHPEDLKNLLSLFQETKRSTLDGITDLDTYFARPIKEYNEIMRQRGDLSPNKLTQRVKKIYDKLRNDIIEQITIRRTRHNIQNYKDYLDDLNKNNIKFPDIEPPYEWKYRLNDKLAQLYRETVIVLTEQLDYTRYRAIEHLVPPFDSEYSENARLIAKNLAGIYRINMIKRLESSFCAFKRSLKTFLDITQGMIDMYHADKVVILGGRDNTLRKLQNEGLELDEILRKLEEKGKLKDNCFPQKAFKKEFIQLLENDRRILIDLQAKWQTVDEDPKLDLFIEKLHSELFDTNLNQTGKLVVFSESVDTVNYLAEQLKDRFKEKKLIAVTSQNRDSKTDTISANFDANVRKDEQKDDYQIVISSDVLSEGVNLHRSHLIVNYDSPWNATSLMQRIGRVNRIGSVSDKIRNYMFYPSDEGDSIIQLTSNAIAKLQAFHTALGEDAQVFSHEEIVHQFELFNTNVKDEVDDYLDSLREVRKVYANDRNLYEKIRHLPQKIRVARKPKKIHKSKSTIAYIASDYKSQFYMISDGCTPISFAEAVKLLKSKADECAEPFNRVRHNNIAHVHEALEYYQHELEEYATPNSIQSALSDPKSQEAGNILRRWMRDTKDAEIQSMAEDLVLSLKNGTYAQLPKQIKQIEKNAKKQGTISNTIAYIREELTKLIKHKSSVVHITNDSIDITPEIVLSETFV